MNTKEEVIGKMRVEFNLDRKEAVKWIGNAALALCSDDPEAGYIDPSPPTWFEIYEVAEEMYRNSIGIYSDE